MEKEKDDDEITIEGISDGIRKIKPNNLRAMAIILVIIIAASAGYQAGYINGYSYVEDWYKEYNLNNCFCFNEPNSRLNYQTPFLQNFISKNNSENKTIAT